MANRIDRKFSELSASGRKGLFPFLVAGQPDMKTTIQIIQRLEKVGIAGVELGFPFTDPVADGPVIQSAFTQAISDGITVATILNEIAKARSSIAIPIIAMVSASIVYKIGIDQFLSGSSQAGIDGFIIPDLSLEEAPIIADKAASKDLRLSMLISPNTPPARQERIAKTASGFLYYMSISGITGERDRLPDDLVKNVARIKEISRVPVLVGFGIKTAQQVRQVCTVADGAIVGSAIVRRIAQAKTEGKDSTGIVESVESYVVELMTGTTGVGIN
ncbi:MAG: tryptophan synthase subunit alpha [Phycisphaerae bacterium]